MKKDNTLQALSLMLLALFLFCATSTFAQIKWVGSGDGTSWQDAANWEPAMVPPADSLVLISKNALITGTAAIAPVRVTISGGSAVALNLDLTIGNGTANEHAVVVNAKSTLSFGAGHTFNLHPNDTKQGIVSFAAADSVTVNVGNGATVNILSGTNGINLANAITWVNNEGAIHFASTVKNGFKSASMVTNNGTMNFDNNVTDGIQVLGGTFNNSGTITVTKPGDDCIEIISGGTFNNFGMLELVAKDSAGTGNNAISIGQDTTAGTFFNASSGTVNANAGGKETARAISVNEMGSFTNLGSVVLGGLMNGTSRFYNRGNSVNDMNGVLDLGDGRGNINLGTFTNNGLVKSAFGTGAGLLTAGSSINNAFYDYANGSQFSGGMGTTTDHGIDLNDPTRTTIDAGGTCGVDIAETPYSWYEGATFVATASLAGAVNFPDMSLTADPAVLTTSIPGVAITVKNVCPAATGASTVFSRNNETVQLHIYPSLVSYQSELTIELSENMQSSTLVFDIVDLSGQLVKSTVTEGGQLRSLNVEGLGAGMYFVSGRDGAANLIGRFVVAK